MIKTRMIACICSKALRNYKKDIWKMKVGKKKRAKRKQKKHKSTKNDENLLNFL